LQLTKQLSRTLSHYYIRLFCRLLFDFIRLSADTRPLSLSTSLSLVPIDTAEQDLTLATAEPVPP
jgi:hypothetical protein